MRTKYSKRNVINVITLGCSKNIFDSEVLMGQLKANDKNVVHQERGNIVVINTCGFIDNAKEESVNTILEQIQFKKEGKVDEVYVTGCLSERYKTDLEKEIPQVDAYFGTSDLPQLLKVGKITSMRLCLIVKVYQHLLFELSSFIFFDKPLHNQPPFGLG